MIRRDFFKTSLFACAAFSGSYVGCRRNDQACSNIGQIMTVLGPIEPDQLGMTLSHEHILVDFIGAGQVSPDRYDQEVAFDFILPYLQEAKSLGCEAFVECTPSYIGKDALLCRRLSEATGLHILTNVGYYGAANDKFIPQFAYEETAEQLAERWIKDAMNVDGTGVHAGFIKIGVDKTSLSYIDAKLVHAAAKTHLHTGLTIYSHTGYATPAMEQIAILKKESVHPGAWVWTHAQNEMDNDQHEIAAKEGAWIAFDGLNPQEERVARDVAHLSEMKKRGLLDHVLLSHDAGWYRPAEEQRFRPYNFLFKEFLGRLEEIGFTREEVLLITVENPKRALTINVRRI